MEAASFTVSEALANDARDMGAGRRRILQSPPVVYALLVFISLTTGAGYSGSSG